MTFSSFYMPALLKFLGKQEGPAFFYDLDFLQQHLQNLIKNRHPHLKLWYACKANPLSAIIKIVRNLNIGVDVASIGELGQVLRNGVQGDHIISTGPAKSKKFLEELLSHQVNAIICEGPNQLLWLDQIAKKIKIRPRVLLRVQFEHFKFSQFKSKSKSKSKNDTNDRSSVLGGELITPFGLSPSSWKELNPQKYHHLEIVGLHAFQWGNILLLDQLEIIWNETILNLLSLYEDLGLNTSSVVLDLGGGIGVPYLGDQSDITSTSVLSLLAKLITKFSLNEVWMELGRFAVASCGFYFNQVVDKKIVRGKNLLVLEGGINHLARPALTKSYFPCFVFPKENKKSSPLVPYALHGPLCTALDFLGEYFLPKDISVGDWLCFSQTGAYGFTESMPFFLCHPMATECIGHLGNFMIPRPSRPSSDWMV